MAGEIVQDGDLARPEPLPGGADDASLRAAVAGSRSWRGVLRTYGLTAPRAGRRLQQACDERGIDYSHFGSRAWNDDQLRQALSTASGWPKVIGALGYAKDSGSARATIRKHAVRLGLDASRLTGPPVPDSGDPFAQEADPGQLRAAGAYLVAGACALLGHKVSWPLEPAVYDLVVDTGRLQRVQVKTTTWRVDGQWTCKITHSASGQKAWYTSAEIGYFAIVDGDLHVHMIPVAVLEGLGTIVVRHYQAYRVATDVR